MNSSFPDPIRRAAIPLRFHVAISALAASTLFVVAPTVAVWAGLGPGCRAAADEIYLKNGGRLEGTLVNPDQSPRENYILQTAFGGRVVLAQDQVDHVVVKSEAEKQYEAFVATLPDTAESHWDVAERCRVAGLDEQREFHLRQVLRHEPDHELARRALGYSKIDGKWFRQEDWMEEHGYVRDRGAWRLPQEIELERELEAYEEKTVAWRQKLKIWTKWLLKGRDNVAEGRANIQAIRDPMAAPALADQARDRELPVPVRLLMIDVLADLGPGVGDPLFVQLALEDSNKTIRDRCLDHLERTKSKYAVAAFIKGLQHEENIVVQRAALGLGRLKDPSATLPLIDALFTEHKRVVGGNRINPTFSDQGSGLSFGGGPKVVKQKVRNDAVLTALTSIHSGVNYRFDQDAWRRWYVQQTTPQVVDLRRGG